MWCGHQEEDPGSTLKSWQLCSFMWSHSWQMIWKDRRPVSGETTEDLVRTVFTDLNISTASWTLLLSVFWPQSKRTKKRQHFFLSSFFHFNESLEISSKQDFTCIQLAVVNQLLHTTTSEWQLWFLTMTEYHQSLITGHVEYYNDNNNSSLDL